MGGPHSSADESDDKPKRQRRSEGDAIQYLAERDKVSDQLKEEDLKIRKEHQTLEREKIEVLRKQQMQMQMQMQQQRALRRALKVMQQQQQQSQQQLLNSDDDDDDDGAATAAGKGFDGVIGKNNTYNK